MGVTTFFVLLALVVLRVGLVLLGAALIVRPVSDCPACFGPTLLLRRPVLRRLIPWIEWRWCPGCGWHGPGKRRTTVSTRGPGRGVEVIRIREEAPSPRGS